MYRSIIIAIICIIVSSIEAPCKTHDKTYESTINDSWGVVDFIDEKKYDQMCPYGDTFVLDVELSLGTQKDLGYNYDCIRSVKDGWEVKNFDLTTKSWKPAKIIPADRSKFRVFTMEGELIKDGNKITIIDQNFSYVR